MQQMGLAGHHEVVGGKLVKSEMLAQWECRECGTREEHPASIAEKGLTVCDFCSSADPVTMFPCRDIETLMVAIEPESGKLVKSQPWFSYGGWAACEPCAKLIEADDQPALTAHAVGMLMARQDGAESRDFIRLTLGQMHRAFFRHRIK